LYIETKLKDCLFVSGWDADFATEAYRQQVEALAQHQVHVINSYVDFKKKTSYVAAFSLNVFKFNSLLIYFL